MRRLLRGENDIPVVREHEDHVGVYLVKGFNEILCGRVHALTSVHDHVSPSFTEGLFQSLSAGNGYDAVGLALPRGEGLKETFRERGADVIVDGGQSMNPSAEDLIAAFDETNADVIFVFPNNGNIILTARQAARLYEGSDVRVIESTTIGAGYASLAMLDTSSGDTDTIEEELRMAMEGVVTAEISHCVRDAAMDGKDIRTGDYIGFVGKELLAANGPFICKFK